MLREYKKYISFLLPWMFLALVMNIMRDFMTDVPSYLWMNWNLFLAIVPFVFSTLFVLKKNKYLRATSFFLWLFFLPNAAYMITDLIHLRNVGPDWMLWYDGMMLFAYALVGIFLSATSLSQISHDLFKNNLFKRNIFVAAISFLSAFGIYLGRYIRWNSWDIFTRPIDVATNIYQVVFDNFHEPVFVTTLVFFSLCIFLSWYSWEILQNKKEA